MAFIDNDSELIRIFHSESIMFNRNNETTFGITFDDVPLDKRIYVFEDIDAECDIIHQRKEIVHENLSIKEQHMKTKLDELNSKKLTLAGILNALDGVIEIIGSVVIITTNHPEKLDAALIRPGRITMNIEMKKCLPWKPISW